MKKTLVVATMCLFICIFTLSLYAEEKNKKINILGGLGFALSDMEGLFIDVGAEMHLKKKFWAQILIDYYFDPVKNVIGVDTSAYSVNLYGVYKHKLKKKATAFAKAGINMTMTKVSTTILGIKASETTSDFGVGAGGGIIYPLKEKLSLIAGATVRFLFGDGDATWFKIYAGVNYALKK